jgi:hypothetical protein
MNEQHLIPADLGKHYLQQLLKRKIPKTTLQRWRKAASVRLEKDGEIYCYKPSDLMMIFRLVENLSELPPSEKTLKNAYFNAYLEIEGDN